MWPFHRKLGYKAILEQHIDGDFSVFACGKDAPTEGVIQQFEREVGFQLPKEFRKFSMSPLGGIYIEVKEHIWPRAKEYAVGPFWSILYGMFIFGFGKKVPGWMDIRLHTPKFRENTKSSLVPFLKILGDADVYCFDERGLVVRWDHGTGQANLVDKSFLEVFAHELEELRKRKDRKKAEPGDAANAALPPR